MNERLVALIDMDCFYCQVETRLNPSLNGKPMAVVQYNQWKGGGIIAVNYEARERGVTRHMRGEEAKRHCPEIELVSVPSVRGKADLTKYRDAGREVIKIICEFSKCVQRASVDEAYIDLTDAVHQQLQRKVKVTAAQLDNTFVVGYSPEGSNDEVARGEGVLSWLEEVYSTELSDPGLHRLAMAAALVEQMRVAVFRATGFHCSAGISHNKILAKLVCGLHKPQRQTVLPMSSVPELYRALPVKKVRNLGGKLGDDVVERLAVTYMGDLTVFTEKQLQSKYDEKTGTWLYNIARGIDQDPVTPQLISKTIGCRKNFPGKNALSTRQSVTHWVSELAAELAERLDEDLHMNKRKAQLMTAHFSHEVDGKDIALSRSVSLPGYEGEKIAASALSVLSKYNTAPPSSDSWDPPLKSLGISTGKFVDVSSNANNPIDKFFKAVPSASSCVIDQTVERRSDKNKNMCSVAETEGDGSRPEVKALPAQSSNSTTVRRKSDCGVDIEEKSNNNITVGRTSFFERYFKNQPNKIVKKSSISVNQPIEELAREDIGRPITTHSSVTTQKRSDNFDPLRQRTENGNGEEASVGSGKQVKPPSEGDQDCWISPSEIFPDVNNIDDSVMHLLPSPLQRKISKIKDNLSSKSKSVRDGFGVDRLSTDCNFAPTVVETVADVYPSPKASTSATTVPKHYVLSCDSVTSDDDIEVNSVFNSTSLDMFASQIAQSVEHEPRNVICDKCSESICERELQEHLDHHIAMELQEQFNKQVQPNRTTSEVRTDKVVQSDGKKRGRPGKKDISAPKKSRTIMSFFTKA